MTRIIRSGGLSDLDDVFQLNCEVFVECWSYIGLKHALMGSCKLLICELNGIFSGYLLTQNILNEIHIMQIAIVPRFQCQGLAQDLTNQMIQQNRECVEASLEVRASNISARKLYIKMGFSETGCRKNYYTPNEQGIRENAILMTKILDTNI